MLALKDVEVKNRERESGEQKATKEMRRKGEDRKDGYGVLIMRFYAGKLK